MSVGPHRRTSALGALVGRVGDIAGRAAGGSLTEEARRLPTVQRRSLTPAPSSSGGFVSVADENFAAATSVQVEIQPNAVDSWGVTIQLRLVSGDLAPFADVWVNLTGWPGHIAHMVVDGGTGIATAFLTVSAAIWNNWVQIADSIEFSWSGPSTGYAGVIVVT